MNFLCNVTTHWKKQAGSFRQVLSLVKPVLVGISVFVFLFCCIIKKKTRQKKQSNKRLSLLQYLEVKLAMFFSLKKKKKKTKKKKGGRRKNYSCNCCKKARIRVSPGTTCITNNINNSCVQSLTKILHLLLLCWFYILYWWAAIFFFFRFTKWLIFYGQVQQEGGLVSTIVGH